jgi:hypothetical protein
LVNPVQQATAVFAVSLLNRDLAGADPSLAASQIIRSNRPSRQWHQLAELRHPDAAVGLRGVLTTGCSSRGLSNSSELPAHRAHHLPIFLVPIGYRPDHCVIAGGWLLGDTDIGADLVIALLL